MQDTKAEDLARAIRAAAAGQVQLTPQAAARLLQALPAPESPAPPRAQETDLLRLLAQGDTNGEIAHRLGLSEQAAKRHVTAILRKLGVLGRIRAALYAVQSGLIPRERVGELRLR